MKKVAIEKAFKLVIFNKDLNQVSSSVTFRKESQAKAEEAEALKILSKKVYDIRIEPTTIRVIKNS